MAEKLGLLASLSVALAPRRRDASTALPVRDRGWWRIFESFPGAWQRNVVVDRESVLTYHAVYAVVTLIASDIAKLGMCLKREDRNGIWNKEKNSSYSPLLRKPNHFQTHIQFWENWLLSKLIRGNTYVLKIRDSAKIVRQLIVLDPARVKPLVADRGDVYYQLNTDNLAGLGAAVTVPATEIIHDRWNCIYHPLIGTSPILACGVASMQGLAIQNNQTTFFQNRSMPGGILTAPGAISDDTAKRLKEAFESNFGGENTGKLAVVGDGLKYEPISFTSQEMQMIEQLKWTAEVVCAVYHVPPYKIGAGPLPANSNVQSLNLEYYSQALQRPIEDAEACLDDGLGLTDDLGVEFNIDNLLRMDTVSQMDVLQKGSGIMKINEQRKKLNLPPLPSGGDTVYLQEQNYSVEALAKRDAKSDPWASSSGSKPPTNIPQPATPALPAPADGKDVAPHQAPPYHTRNLDLK